MATEVEEFVALQDEEGHYYLLPRRVVEGARVADESVERVQALLTGSANAAGEDVSGYGIITPQSVLSSPASQTFASRGIIIVSGYGSLSDAGIRFVPSLGQ